MGKNGRSWTYEQQCLIAIARALPTDDDLRKKKPETRLEWAKSLVFGWGYRRSRSEILRDLSDSEFVEVVMEMQMQKMVESTRAKR